MASLVIFPKKARKNVVFSGQTYATIRPMPLDILLEGWLFYKAGPLKKAEITKELNVSLSDLVLATGALRDRLQNGGLRLVETESELQLVTAPALGDFMEALQKAEVKKDIGKAGAETLAIILYKNTVSRAEIDRIRGVNSTFILRNLLVRGLVERSPAKTGGGYVFTISTALLEHLGVEKVQDLQDFSAVMSALDNFGENETETNETVNNDI